MKLTNLPLFLALFLLFAPGTIAQEKMIARDGFEEGYRAIQFGIGDNFRLNNFDDTHFSFLKYKSEIKAWFIRGSINSSFNTSDHEDANQSERPGSDPPESEHVEQRNISRTLTNLRVHLGTLNYMNTQSDVLPFISRSLFLGMNLTTVSEEREFLNTSSPALDNHKLESNNFLISPVVGVNGGFGVEYFMTKNISLHAQTGLEFSYSFSNSSSDFETRTTDDGILTEVRINNKSQKSHEISLRTTGVLFGLSAFF